MCRGEEVGGQQSSGLSMQKRSPAGLCYGMYTYLAVLLGSAVGSAGLDC
jgi:hypothetical protein